VTVATRPTARLRRFELSATAFRRLAVATAVALWAIVVSGALVRLTASGLGCESWPGCETGSFFPASDHHAFVEFGNRTFSLIPIALSAVAAFAAWRTAALPARVRWLALATVVGTLAQAPLGFITIYFDLHPLLVLSHFLLALVVLATAVIVAVEAWAVEAGRGEPLLPRRLRAPSVALVLAGCVLIVTGTLATAAGPHSGGSDIRRYGNLIDAMWLHVRAAAVFGVLFAALLVILWRRRATQPRAFGAAAAVLAVLVVQMGVGELQWRTELPWGLVLVHVGLAGAVWGLLVALVYAFWRPPKPLTRA
jgi:cytochrome c oxidase assembly protein subunit 15